MKIKITIMLSVLFLLLFVGNAGAIQVLLPGKSIPKFVDPLPVASTPTVPGITVVDARAGGANETPTADIAPADGINDNTFIIAAEEFQAQILPAAFYGPSWVWGYLVPGDDPNVVRPSYLGPVVVAQKGVPFYPEYFNNLPVGGFVQANLPIDMTLDWANPTNIDCLPVLDPLTGLYNYTNPACGGAPPYMGPVPIATHLHGGEVAPAFDGGPDAWFTPDLVNNITGLLPPDGIPDKIGTGFPGNVYEYPNEQQESTLWFHDHALGITRLNVYAGLAGVYPIIDVDPTTGSPGPTAPLVAMPAFPKYDIPLIIQDRSFDTNGQIFYNLASNPQPNPTVHPFWIPEFIGDTIVVNGKTWPYLNVEPRQYRFRFVNGSNARFYDLTLNMTAGPVGARPPRSPRGKTPTKPNPALPFIVIATDDGYLMNAVSTPNVIIGPGERYEVIVDFSAVPIGAQIIMKNAARTPFPGGGKPTNNGTDTVMLFRVNLALSGVLDTTIAAGTAIRPTPLVPIVTAHNPASGSITRQLTLNEVIGPGGPLELVVNNSKFNLAGIIPGSTTPLGRETELPAVGDTEIWEIINITADAHPMHLHLVSFQVLDRTPFNAAAWITQYDALMVANGVLPGEGPPGTYNVKNLDGAIGGNPAINASKIGPVRLPLPYEMGWKDTVITYPGEVTRIAVRWATTDTAVGAAGEGVNTYLFDPTVLTGGVGYVWHCHIIDHEDNEMMRNYVVGTLRQPVF